MLKCLNYDEEIKLCDEKIAKLKQHRQKLLKAKTAQENEEIISVVKGNNMSLEQLKELISAFSDNPTKSNTTKGDLINET